MDTCGHLEMVPLFSVQILIQEYIHVSYQCYFPDLLFPDIFNVW